MRRNRGLVHPVARRAALACMTVVASSAIGMLAAPALGQIIIPIGGPILGSSQGATVNNAGSASANTGGNSAVGNNSTNDASTSSTGGGLLDVPVELGAPTNQSSGVATVTSGPADAVGNSADTTVGQSNASGTQVTSFLAGQHQGATVTNAGSAGANTGGNTAIGNNSQNNASTSQEVVGGLLGVGVSLGGPVNNSSGEATINSGAATAAGNSSSTQVGQAAQRGGSGGVLGAGGGALGGPCGAGRFASFQSANVSSVGDAEANTGNNEAIGNASTNDASVTSTQTVSGGLLGVGVSLGGPVNNSSGNAVINTGPATAAGNDSVTTVGQSEACLQAAAAPGSPRHPVVVPVGHVHPKHIAVHQPRALARTGLDSADLGMIGGALLGAGMLLVVSQRRRLAARHASVPMAGFGLGLGGDDWDRAVR